MCLLACQLDGTTEGINKSLFMARTILQDENAAAFLSCTIFTPCEAFPEYVKKEWSGEQDFFSGLYLNSF
jgi:hypothetical protein